MIPDKPAVFTPEGLPPNTVDMRASFWSKRKMQIPRITLVHTNGAGGIATNQSSKNWLESKPQSNTCPHYQVQLDGRAAKYLPTNRVGLDNATMTPSNDGWSALPAVQRADIVAHGQVRDWSIGIETSDLGYAAGKPGDLSGFTDAQVETLAGILAYEAIVWDIPLDYPTSWWGTGTACHTEPFTYPFWTLFRGKSCPGSLKKTQMRSRVLPRAIEIRDAWIGVPAPAAAPAPAPTAHDPGFAPQEDDKMYRIVKNTNDPRGRVFGTDGVTKTLIGSPEALGAAQYASGQGEVSALTPEQMRGLGLVDPRCKTLRPLEFTDLDDWGAYTGA